MKKGFIFWLLMIIWFIFGLWWYWPGSGGFHSMGPIGGHLLDFALFFLLGWHCFGFVVQD